MHLTADMLADKLDIDLEKSHLMADTAGQYHAVRYLLPDLSRLETEAAYVADSAQLSKLEYIDPRCLIICPADKEFSAKCSVLVSRDDLAGTFSAAVSAAESYSIFDSMLKDSLLAEQGLDGLLDICARFFQNMVQILDPAFHVIAGITPVTDPASSEIIAYQQDISSFSASTLDEMAKNNLLQETYTFQTAQFHKSPLFKYRAIISNLFKNNHYLGKLLIIENTTSLGQGAIDTVNQIVPYFNHLMQKRSAELNVTLQTIEHFISEILKGNISDVAFAEAQIARMNWHMDDHFIVLTIQIQARILADFYAQIVRNHLREAVVFPDRDYLVAVIRLQSTDLTELERRIGTVLADAGLQCGISEIFTPFSLARDFYIQADNALDAANRMRSPGLLHHYRDQAINHLYLLASRSDEIKAFIHPAIPLIVRYDQDNNTEYLKTLSIYFESSYNQVLAASRLHIHRKSLQYRLNRLMKIAPLNLNDPDEQIRLMLSLRFYENEQLRE